jgi:CheY-like chemotaxis protein
VGEVQILIVEDDSIIAEYIAIVLTRQGYRVAGIVGTGEEAVAAVLRGQPDIILMDIRMDGDFDGITAASRIKERADIPIVYLTAYRNPAVMDRAAKTKPSGYLCKPFRSTSLIDVIETALGNRRHEASGE